MRIVGLDVGEKRIGVARVDSDTKIALPYGTVLVSGAELEEIHTIAKSYGAELIIVGLPRNSAGVETMQSVFTRNFAARLKTKYREFRIHFQDETLTSVEAERRLKSRGRSYQKADIDSEAATIILQDFMDSCINQSRYSNVAIDEILRRVMINTNKTRLTLPKSVKERLDSNGVIKLHSDESPTSAHVASSVIAPTAKSTSSEASFAATTTASDTDYIDKIIASQSSTNYRSAPSSAPGGLEIISPLADEEDFPDLLSVDTANTVTTSSPLIKSSKSSNPQPSKSLKSPAPSKRHLYDSIRKIPNSVTTSLRSAIITPAKSKLSKLKTKKSLTKSLKTTDRQPLSGHSVKPSFNTTDSSEKTKFPLNFRAFFTKKPSFKRFLPVFFVILPISIAIFCTLWYNNNISALSSKDSCKKYTALCTKLNFKVSQGDTADTIINNLFDSRLIKNKDAFKLYLKLNRRGGAFKAGLHELDSSLSVAEIVTELEKTNNNSVFSFTILPGENIFQVKKKLVAAGYGTVEIDEAFGKQYDHPILSDKPKGASLEGYLFAETYEFFKEESLEKIITKLLDQTNKFVNENNLRDDYQARGFNLHQGLTLASIIQKETNKEHDVVAQIFEKRLKQNEKLGSDVTVSYALELLDPTREKYTTNSAKLEIDSPYNTRKNTGLPPTPISAPGAAALKAVAHPASTEYLYFLTGDDGKMYYSKTDAEHNYNIRQFCQKLCAVGL